ncbi:MAG TPA: C40 family peptidase [Gemmatimonadaceae bacterium]|nr:C40 family peptidase [Gemmatimonadaceae bacterium]
MHFESPFLRSLPRPARWRTLLLAALLMVPSVVRAQDGVRVTPPYQPLRPLVPFSDAVIALQDSIVGLARRQLGTRYVRGGESPEHGFDCSGLVKYLVASLHLSLPRTAAQQATVGRAIPADTSQLLPGDLLTFGRGKKITHIAIYVGDGRMIQASSGRRRVVETNVVREPGHGVKPWRGVRRVLPEDIAPDSSDAVNVPAPVAAGSGKDGGE